MGSRVSSNRTTLSPLNGALIWNENTMFAIYTVALLYTGGDYLLIVCLFVPIHVHVLGAETLSV